MAWIFRGVAPKPPIPTTAYRCPARCGYHHTNTNLRNSNTSSATTNAPQLERDRRRLPRHPTSTHTRAGTTENPPHRPAILQASLWERWVRICNVVLVQFTFVIVCLRPIIVFRPAPHLQRPRETSTKTSYWPLLFINQEIDVSSFTHRP